MDTLDEFMQERKKRGLLRSLRAASFRKEGKIYVNGNEYVDFSSNDYLGLAAHPSLKEASIKAIEKYGTSASASRLLSGDLEIHHELERKLALLKGKDSALLFNSGYQANVGIIGTLFGREDAIFSDRLNHASIIDGILLSGAKLFRFQHNDLNHLESLLESKRHKFREALIVTETIFSMDGDMCPIEELVDLKERYDCKIMVDEAHATGIFGRNGYGMVEEKKLADRIDLIMGTFSKALGSFGAYVACSQKIKDYLINSCRSFIYSTALPPSIIAANLASLELIGEEPFRRKTLLDNAEYFRDGLQRGGFQIRGCSQIVPVIIGDSLKTEKLSQELRNRGHWILPIRPPTVPVGEARIRLSLTYYHTKEMLDLFVSDLYDLNNL